MQIKRAPTGKAAETLSSGSASWRFRAGRLRAAGNPGWSCLPRFLVYGLLREYRPGEYLTCLSIMFPSGYRAGTWNPGMISPQPRQSCFTPPERLSPGPGGAGQRPDAAPPLWLSTNLPGKTRVIRLLGKGPPSPAALEAGEVEAASGGCFAPRLPSRATAASFTQKAIPMPGSPLFRIENLSIGINKKILAKQYVVVIAER